MDVHASGGTVIGGRDPASSSDMLADPHPQSAMPIKRRVTRRWDNDAMGRGL
jgi:hypothetical protein